MLQFVPVTTTITQRELRNSSGDIMRRLDAGETFIVTRAGKPVGELSPLHRPRFVNTDTVLGQLRGRSRRVRQGGRAADGRMPNVSRW